MTKNEIKTIANDINILDLFIYLQMLLLCPSKFSNFSSVDTEIRTTVDNIYKLINKKLVQ